MLVFLVAIGGVLLGAPLFTQSGYRALFMKEREQIAVDNAGIQAGRLLSEAVRRIEEATLLIGQMEHLHHGAHACRTENPSCLSADAIFEKKLRQISRQAYLEASGLWAQGRKAIGEASLRLGIHFSVDGYASDIPLAASVCPVCGESYVHVWESGFFPRLITIAGGQAVEPVFLCLPVPSVGYQYQLFSRRESCSRKSGGLQ